MRRPAPVLYALALGAAACGRDAQPAPVILFDEAHFNYPVEEGSADAVIAFLEEAGYTVVRSESLLTRAALDSAQVLIVGMALAERNRIQQDTFDWSLPTPSAFSDTEIETVQGWVDDGGGLLLLTDHMPFAGAAEALLGAFGIHTSNGFAHEAGADVAADIVYRRSDGSLAGHPITDGVAGGEGVDSVVTAVGSALRPTPGLDPLLVLRPGSVSLEPDTAWVFDEETPVVPVDGWLQGGAAEIGRGRLVVFAEAGMFFALLQTVRDPEAMAACREPCWVGPYEQNPLLLLNTVAWLARRAPEG